MAKFSRDGKQLVEATIPQLQTTFDNFGNLISRNTTNEADIGAEYNFNPERLRLYQDGERVFVQYGENPTNTEGNPILEDAVDSYFLKPSQDSIVTITTAERFRYIVGYVIRPSFAFGVSGAPQEGDEIWIGYGNTDINNDFANANGWFFNYTGDLPPDKIRIVVFRAGDRVVEEVVDINQAVNVWKRMCMWINWYNVGSDKFQETYSTTTRQFNPILGEFSPRRGRGPTSANQRVEFTVKRGLSNSPVELEVGSIGVETLGDVGVVLREKISTHSHSFTTTGSWVPILAIRTKPDYENVFSDLEELNITNFGGAGDVTLAAQVCDPSKVLDSGGNILENSDYATPVEQNDINSSIEVSTNVAQAPDSNGTPQTSIATGTGVGGYQIAFAELKDGSGFLEPTKSFSSFIKRAIHDIDVVVIYGLATSQNTVDYRMLIEQDH